MSVLNLQHLKKCLLLILISIFLISCASPGETRKNNKFEYRLRGFSQAIRWSKFEDAISYIRLRDSTPAEPRDIAFLKSIKTTKYKQIQPPIEDFEPESTDRLVSYHLEYYVEPSYTLKQLQYDQRWWYDEKTENWFLDSNLPAF